MDKKRKKKKNRQNDVLFVRNGIREMGTNALPRKTYLEGTIFNTLLQKLKKKYVVALKIFVVFILDVIVY